MANILFPAAALAPAAVVVPATAIAAIAAVTPILAVIPVAQVVPLLAGVPAVVAVSAAEVVLPGATVPPLVLVLLPAEAPLPLVGAAYNQGMFSCPDLAHCFGLHPETLRKRLERWRNTPGHDAGWDEVLNARHHEAHFLYRLADVRHLLYPTLAVELG